MNRFIFTMAAAALLHVASPAKAKSADDIAAARKQTRLAFETPATKASLARAMEFLNTGKPGRSCDNSDAMVLCEMEDGVSISVEAVPSKTTKAEAAVLCVNPFADEPRQTTIELKGGDAKAGFTLLWCADKATPALKAAAEKRIAAVYAEKAEKERAAGAKRGAIRSFVRSSGQSNKHCVEAGGKTTCHFPGLPDTVVYRLLDKPTTEAPRRLCPAVGDDGGDLNIANIVSHDGADILTCSYD